MQKDDLVYVGHMLDKTLEAMNLVKGKDRTDYDSEASIRYALAHLLQIIGEAARRISPDFCKVHPEIPWKAIIGMRHKVVHDYMSVDEDVVWDTVQQELPPLIKLLNKIVNG